MATYFIYETSEVQDTYTVEADSYQEAKELHLEGQSEYTHGDGGDAELSIELEEE